MPYFRIPSNGKHRGNGKPRKKAVKPNAFEVREQQKKFALTVLKDSVESCIGLIKKMSGQTTSVAEREAANETLENLRYRMDAAMTDLSRGNLLSPEAARKIRRIYTVFIANTDENEYREVLKVLEGLLK